MTHTTDDTIVLGKILKPHGINGALKIRSYTAPAENLFNYKPWQVIHPSDQVQSELIFTSYKHNVDHFIVETEFLTTPEQASIYTHALLAVSKDQLPTLSPTEFYWHELEGFQVINHQQQSLGCVDYLCEGPQSDLIICRLGKKTLVIPYDKETVRHIDKASQTIHVQWYHPDDLP